MSTDASARTMLRAMSALQPADAVASVMTELNAKVKAQRLGALEPAVHHQVHRTHALCPMLD